MRTSKEAQRTLGKHKRKDQCRLPYFLDEDEKIVYLSVKSHITAMGVPAIAARHFPGFTPKIATLEYIETLREVHEKKLEADK